MRGERGAFRGLRKIRVAARSLCKWACNLPRLNLHENRDGRGKLIKKPRGIHAGVDGLL